MNRRMRHKGLALPLVLWMVALLSILASGFTYLMKAEMRQARGFIESVEAEAAAQAAVNYMVMRIRNSDLNTNPFLAEEFTLLDMFGQSVVARLVPEASLLDLNIASRAALSSLLRAAGEGDESISAILDQLADWRDKNDETMLNGAEAEDYAAAGLYPGPRNADLLEVVELRQIPAVNEELYLKIAPYLTVSGRAKGLNLNYAPAEMISFLVSGQAVSGEYPRLDRDVAELKAQIDIPSNPVGNRYRIDALVIGRKGNNKGYFVVHVGLGGRGFNVRRFNAFKISSWQQSAAPQDIVEYARNIVKKH